MYITGIMYYHRTILLKLIIISWQIKGSRYKYLFHKYIVYIKIYIHKCILQYIGNKNTYTIY